MVHKCSEFLFFIAKRKICKKQWKKRGDHGIVFVGKHYWVEGNKKTNFCWLYESLQWITVNRQPNRDNTMNKDNLMEISPLLERRCQTFGHLNFWNYIFFKKSEVVNDLPRRENEIKHIYEIVHVISKLTLKPIDLRGQVSIFYQTL